jgi:electron transport complex protein RnfG
MKYVKSVIVLTSICLAAALLLSYVNLITKDAIAANEKAEALRMVEKVLTGYDNNLDGDRLQIEGITVYRGFKAGAFTGAAIQTESRQGYGGTIKIMLGVDAEGKVTGLEVVSHSETPGLGTKVTAGTWKEQLRGLSLASGVWKVRKDDPNGVVDEVTGATISSRAVIGAADQALRLFDNHREEVMKAPEPEKAGGTGGGS